MNNLNDFNKTVKSYVEKNKTPCVNDDVHEIIIDCRPDAIVGKMIVNPPTTDEERDDYVAAMIAGIAEIVAGDVAFSVEEVAMYYASRFGEATGELYAMDMEEEDLF